MSGRASSLPVRAPLWARAYRASEVKTPNHRGKGTLIRALHRFGLRRGPFVWRVDNGNLIVVAPEEGLLVRETVGWTCFLSGRWEPHVEGALRDILRPGGIAVDIGANLGYFAAVMAQAVGPSGEVFAFEPVPDTFARLLACRRLNQLSQLTCFQIALGDADREVVLSFDRRVAGSASMHAAGAGVDVPAKMKRLDALLEAGEVRRPDLIKLDVEGNELAALRGGVTALEGGSTSVLFEFNANAASAAGWTMDDLVNLLDEHAAYDYRVLGGEGARVDPRGLRIAPGDYVDVLATPR